MTKKGELIHVLHEFTGISKDKIRIYGDYVDYGNKQRLTCGAYTVVKYAGRISIWYPDYTEFPEKIAYAEAEVANEAVEAIDQG